jgi:hypothetical protein
VIAFVLSQNGGISRKIIRLEDIEDAGDKWAEDSLSNAKTDFVGVPINCGSVDEVDVIISFGGNFLDTVNDDVIVKEGMSEIDHPENLGTPLDIEEVFSHMEDEKSDKVAVSRWEIAMLERGREGEDSIGRESFGDRQREGKGMWNSHWAIFKGFQSTSQLFGSGRNAGKFFSNWENEFRILIKFMDIE